jgi:hypothetical protein
MTQKSKLKTLTQKNRNKSKTKFNEQKFWNCIKPNALKKMYLTKKRAKQNTYKKWQTIWDNKTTTKTLKIVTQTTTQKQ